MYDETNVPAPEYRVRPVVRYAVTRYCHPYQAKDKSHSLPGSSSLVGEFQNEEQAAEVADALAKGEQARALLAIDSDELEYRQVEDCLMTFHGWPVSVDGLVATHPGNWARIDEDCEDARQHDPNPGMAQAG